MVPVVLVHAVLPQNFELKKKNQRQGSAIKQSDIK